MPFLLGVEGCGCRTEHPADADSPTQNPATHGDDEMNENHALFLTTKEAADRLRVSRRLLEKLRLAGGGPKYRKLGARVVYALSDLLAWADTGTRTSTSDPGQSKAA